MFNKKFNNSYYNRSSTTINIKYASANITVTSNANTIAEKHKYASANITVVLTTLAVDITRERLTQASISDTTSASVDASSLLNASSVCSVVSNSSAVAYRYIECSGTINISSAITNNSVRHRTANSIIKVYTSASASAEPTFTDAINAHERHIEPFVDVYFNDIPTSFEGTMIDTMSILEELKADSYSPLGSISSNELYLSLANINRQLSPSSASSPYYGKMTPNVKIKPYLRCYINDTEYFNVALGTFFSDDWQDDTDSTLINVTAYDRLYFLKSKNFAGTRIMGNVSYATLFEVLFKSVGLTEAEYNIDPALSSIVVTNAWIPNGSFASAAQFLSEGSISFVFVDRYNIINVQRINKNRPKMATVHDNNQVIKMSIPTAYSSTYSKLSVPITNTKFGTETEVLNMGNISCANGLTTLSNCTFSKTPVGIVTDIVVTSRNVSVEYYNATTDTITIVLNNTGQVENISIIVKGIPLDLSTQAYSMEDLTIKGIIGERIQSIENSLVQTTTMAQNICNDLFPIVTNPHANILLTLRGNPFFTPGNILEAFSDIDQVSLHKILIYRHKLVFSGGLSSDVVGYCV